jgi:hypothetical protein
VATLAAAAAPARNVAAAKAKRKQRGLERKCVSCGREVGNSSAAAYHAGRCERFEGWRYRRGKGGPFDKTEAELRPHRHRGKAAFCSTNVAEQLKKGVPKVPANVFKACWQRTRGVTADNFRGLRLTTVEHALYYLVRLIGYHHGDRVPLPQLSETVLRAFHSGVATKCAMAERRMHEMGPDELFEQHPNGYERAVHDLPAPPADGDDEEWLEPKAKSILRAAGS